MVDVKDADITITALPTVTKKRSIFSKGIYLTLKRLFDIIAGIVGIIILIPLILWVLIMKTASRDKGPLFYYQLRIGKGGKLFKLYKFRSMVVGADDKLKEYLKNNPEEAKEYKKYKKIKNDPRVTKVGKFLRTTSLDEWPQFINVFIGQMSLTGPRPYLPHEKEDIGENAYNEIIKVKPGLTGPWQVSGRSNRTFEDRVMLDLEYIPKAGIKEDLKITLKTIQKVLKRDGSF